MSTSSGGPKMAQKGRDGYAGLRLSKDNKSDIERRNELRKANTDLLKEMDELLKNSLDKGKKTR
jgi:hypothetical protein